MSRDVDDARCRPSRREGARRRRDVRPHRAALRPAQPHAHVPHGRRLAPRPRCAALELVAGRARARPRVRHRRPLPHARRPPGYQPDRRRLLGRACSRAAHTDAPLVRADAMRLPFPDGVVRRAHVRLRAAQLRRPRGRARRVRAGAAPAAAASRCSTSASPRARPRAPCTASGSATSCRSSAGCSPTARAYAYLPASTAYLPPRPELLAIVGDAGFVDVAHRTLGAGAAQLITGTRGVTHSDTRLAARSIRASFARTEPLADTERPARPPRRRRRRLARRRARLRDRRRRGGRRARATRSRRCARSTHRARRRARRSIGPRAVGALPFAGGGRMIIPARIVDRDADGAVVAHDDRARDRGPGRAACRAAPLAGEPLHDHAAHRRSTRGTRTSPPCSPSIDAGAVEKVVLAREVVDRRRRAVRHRAPSLDDAARDAARLHRVRRRRFRRRQPRAPRAPDRRTTSPPGRWPAPASTPPRSCAPRRTRASTGSSSTRCVDALARDVRRRARATAPRRSRSPISTHLATTITGRRPRPRHVGRRPRARAAPDARGRRHAARRRARRDPPARADAARPLRRAVRLGRRDAATASSSSRCAARRSTGPAPGCTRAPASSPARSPTPSGPRRRRSSSRCSARSSARSYVGTTRVERRRDRVPERAGGGRRSRARSTGTTSTRTPADAAARRARARRASLRDVVDALRGDAVRPRDLHEIEAVRRAEELLELGQLAPAAGTRRCRRRRCRARRTSPGAVAPSRPFVSCRKQRSPHSPTVGAGALACATPTTVDTKPSMPFAPRFASTRSPARGAMHHSSARTGRLDATTSVAPSGSAAATSRATRAFARRAAARRARRRSRRGPRARRRASRSSHGDARRRRAERVGDRARAARRRRPRTRSAAARCGSSHAPSGSTSTCGIDGSSHAVAILLVSGAPTRTTRSGRCASAKPGARSSASYVEIARGAVAQLRDRIGEHRPARRRGEPRRGRAVDTPRPSPRRAARADARARARRAASTSAARGARVARRRDASTAGRRRGPARRPAARRSAAAARGTEG